MVPQLTTVPSGLPQELNRNQAKELLLKCLQKIGGILFYLNTNHYQMREIFLRDLNYVT